MTIKLANKTKVSAVAAVSLLGLVVILKNVLGISAEVLSRDVILFIILYSAFGIGYPEHPEGSPPSPLDRPWLWSLFVILMTAAIVVVYAI